MQAFSTDSVLNFILILNNLSAKYVTRTGRILQKKRNKIKEEEINHDSSTSYVLCFNNKKMEQDFAYFATNK